jgi:hypothetical protein
VLSWGKFEPVSGLHPLSATTYHGPLTPGPNIFDEPSTINPDSLINIENDFDNAWSMGSTNAIQESIAPISPTTLSRDSYLTPHSFVDGHYPNSSHNFVNIQQRPSPFIPTTPISIRPSNSSEESTNLKNHASWNSFGTSIPPTEVPTSTLRKNSIEKDHKQSSKKSGQQPRKRRKSNPASSNKHNQIEKRYRTNLNEKIVALRDSVPSLRALQGDDSEENQDVGADDSEDEEKPSSPQRRRSIAKACGKSFGVLGLHLCRNFAN